MPDSFEGAARRAEEARRALESNWSKERDTLLATVAKVEREAAEERVRQRALLDTLSETHEREVEALNQERDRAIADAASLQDSLQTLQRTRSVESEVESRRRNELEQTAADAAVRAQAIAGRNAELEAELKRERENLLSLQAVHQAGRERMKSVQDALEAAQASRAAADEAMRTMQADLSEVTHALKDKEALVLKQRNQLEAAVQERDTLRTAESEVRRVLSDRLAAAEKALEAHAGQLHEANRMAVVREETRAALQDALARAVEALTSESPRRHAHARTHELERQLAEMRVRLAKSEEQRVETDRDRETEERTSRALALRNRELRQALQDKEASLGHEARRREELEVALRRTRRASSPAVEVQTRDLQARILELRGTNTDLEAELEKRDEQLDEWRFARSSIRNTLQSIERDLENEGLHARNHAPYYRLFLSKVSRAVEMSLEALASSEAIPAEPQTPPPVPVSLGRAPKPAPARAVEAAGGRPPNAPAPFADLVAELRSVASEANAAGRRPNAVNDRIGADAAAPDTQRMLLEPVSEAHDHDIE